MFRRQTADSLRPKTGPRESGRPESRGVLQQLFQQPLGLWEAHRQLCRTDHVSSLYHADNHLNPLLYQEVVS